MNVGPEEPLGLSRELPRDEDSLGDRGPWPWAWGAATGRIVLPL